MTKSNGGSARVDTLLDEYKLSAKLPLLGPLIGATVQGAKGLTARVWIQVDNTRDEPPAFALTALWDLEKKCVCPGTARAWKLIVAQPSNANPPPKLHFAVAHVEFLRDTPQCVIRVISLHRKAGSDPGFQFDPMTCTIDWSTPVAMTARAMSMTQSLAGEALPEPTEVQLQGGFAGLAGNLDQLAKEAYVKIQAALDEVAREVRKPIRSKRSRWALDLRCITECEADLAASSCAQLEGTAGEIAFAATCCRHPGMGWDSECIERTYEMLGDAARDPAGPASALLAGDQIYADATAGTFDVADRFEKFSVRYEDAFGARCFRRCASRLPLYMAADDHEVEDNWSRTRLKEEQVPWHQLMRREQLAAWAQMMFIAYQRLHGPRSVDLKRGWYDFKAAGVPFFVMDTRFERYAWGDKHAPQLCNCTQRRALLSWLNGMQELDAADGPLSGVPKFIVSGSVFAPGLEEFRRDAASARSADNWQAFPGMRAALIKAIVHRKLRNVVFLSGDYHCGAVAALELSGAVAKTTYPAYAIVSPPAYAPFPFANVRAADIATEEIVPDPKGAALPALAQIKAEAWEGSGYVTIRVRRDRPADEWRIDVEFRDPATDRRFARQLVQGQIKPR